MVVGQVPFLASMEAKAADAVATTKATKAHKRDLHIEVHCDQIEPLSS